MMDANYYCNDEITSIASKISLTKRKRMRLLKLISIYDGLINSITENHKIQFNYAVIQNIYSMLDSIEM